MAVHTTASIWLSLLGLATIASSTLLDTVKEKALEKLRENSMVANFLEDKTDKKKMDTESVDKPPKASTDKLKTTIPDKTNSLSDSSSEFTDGATTKASDKPKSNSNSAAESATDTSTTKAPGGIDYVKILKCMHKKYTKEGKTTSASSDATDSPTLETSKKSGNSLDPKKIADWAMAFYKGGDSMGKEDKQPSKQAGSGGPVEMATKMFKDFMDSKTGGSSGGGKDFSARLAAMVASYMGSGKKNPTESSDDKPDSIVGNSFSEKKSGSNKPDAGSIDKPNDSAEKTKISPSDKANSNSNPASESADISTTKAPGGIDYMKILKCMQKKYKNAGKTTSASSDATASSAVDTTKSGNSLDPKTIAGWAKDCFKSDEKTGSTGTDSDSASGDKAGKGSGGGPVEMATKMFTAYMATKGGGSSGGGSSGGGMDLSGLKSMIGSFMGTGKKNSDGNSGGGEQKEDTMSKLFKTGMSFIGGGGADETNDSGKSKDETTGTKKSSYGKEDITESYDETTDSTKSSSETTHTKTKKTNEQKSLSKKSSF